MFKKKIKKMYAWVTTAHRKTKEYKIHMMLFG